MNRKYLSVLLCCMIAMLLMACDTYKSLTFKITNGEQIKVRFAITDEYKFSQDEGTMTISKDDTNILMGSFLSEQEYNDYVTAITSSKDVTMLETKPESAPTLYFYQYDGASGTETTYLFRIENAETCAVFVSLASKKEAEDVFQLLTFEKIK